ncbi:ABC transporter permease [Gorillibacterium sp. CAU 1737]|uniref:ABC transporter permease n=1 Tax=Gorillibacterium sp. CAU 1737 TaxID=3140362 RepID=UPI0032614B97
MNAPVKPGGWTTAALYRERTARWRRRVFPYWRDVLRSGAGMLVLLLLLSAGPAYTWALEQMPPDFPYLWIAVPVLAAAVYRSPIRTHLEAADRVFLLPAEPRMAGYLWSARRSAAIRQAILLLIALGALWPLYLRAEGTAAMPFAGALVAALAAKAAAFGAAAAEPRLTRPSLRGAAALLRAVLALHTAYALWRFGPLAGVTAAAGDGAALMALLAAWRRQPLPWERLIALEERQAARYYHFLSWFTDVPELTGTVRKRRLLGALTSRLSFRPESAPLYLYALTYMRREPFGLALRSTAAAGLFILFFRYPYAQVIAAALALIMAGLQASALSQYHRYSSWLYLYPLAPNAPRQAAARIAAVSLTGQGLLLAILLGLGGLPWPLAGACFCGAAAYAAALGLAQARRRTREERLG